MGYTTNTLMCNRFVAVMTVCLVDKTMVIAQLSTRKIKPSDLLTWLSVL